ncbi:MAG: hypothetical protein V2I37_07500 [Marinilabiliaceae bacterium]|jgi:antitoxin component YwqK of YwqJK toxin-antitoxin module|nr:hypothetical protein [Marinilabiliaceae bacterium]
MKYTLVIIALILAACQPGSRQDNAVVKEQSQDDPNYTGIKKFYNGELLIKETTYRNGVKEGLCKNYYDDGKLKRTIIYANDLKEDTAKWYYKEGSVYRATPYRNDKIHGIQTKYYKSGRIWAQIPYRHGLRLPGLKEYYDNGLEAGKIPSIEYNISTTYYEEDGLVTIVLTLDNKSKDVKYYKGGLVDGAFDETRAKDVSASTGMGYVELNRTATGGKGYVDIVAVYTSRFKNKEIIIKRIKLPYNDLI